MPFRLKRSLCLGLSARAAAAGVAPPAAEGMRGTGSLWEEDAEHMLSVHM